MRCTWLAKLETMTRPVVVRKTVSIAGASSPSETVKPGTSALVESTRNRSTPSSPSRAKARRSVTRRSSGNWSILKSPVCSTSPAEVRMATASPSGMEWLTATNSQSNEPNVRRSSSATSTVLGRDAVLGELGLQEGQGQPGADDGDVGALAQQVRDTADVVLVAVGEHDRLDLVEAVPDPGEVGDDDVDAGLVLVGEEHPAVDDRGAGPRARRRSCCGRSRPGRRAARSAARCAAGPEGCRCPCGEALAGSSSASCRGGGVGRQGGRFDALGGIHGENLPWRGPGADRATGPHRVIPTGSRPRRGSRSGH